MRALCLVLAASTAMAQTPPENAATTYREAMEDDPFPEDQDLAARKALSGEALWDEMNLGGVMDVNRESLELLRRGTAQRLRSSPTSPGRLACRSSTCQLETWRA